MANKVDEADKAKANDAVRAIVANDVADKPDEANLDNKADLADEADMAKAN